MTTVKPGYIYFLHAVGSTNGDMELYEGMERYKIGLTTRDVEARLNELNSGQSPFWLVEKWSIQVSDTESAESALHKNFHARRLYLNTQTGESGPYDTIPPQVRKSTEWFMFADDELDKVQESYDAIQNLYPWVMMRPNLKQKNNQQTERQWKQVVNQVANPEQDYGRSHSSTGGGWGCAATLLAIIVAVPLMRGMGDFAENVNSGGSLTELIAQAPKQDDRPSENAPPAKQTDWIGDAVNSTLAWVLSPFNKPTAATIAPLPGYTHANVRSSPNGTIAGNPLPKGTTVTVLERKSGWVRTDRGWVDARFLR